MTLICRRCEAPYVDDDTEGPCDYCQQCRYEVVHADEDEAEDP